MIRFIPAFLCCIFLLTFPLSAQEASIEIEGHLQDEKRYDLIGATIRCYEADSLLIANTTTDSQGNFTLELPAKRQTHLLRINYIGYKEMTLVLNPTDEKLIRLGDITLSTNAILMQEVTVVGSQTVSTEEKTMVYPTREQMRHAYDGYSALAALMIPGMRAQTFQSTPTYMDQAIFFCINGMEASEEEINALNPRDIKRVDFYPNGLPDYPEADVVLDYILKERDYAGTIALNGKQQLNRPYGSGRGTTQYFQDKSEFALSVSDQYTHARNHNEDYTITTYTFPESVVVNTTESLPSDENANDLSSYFNYLYKDKQQTFYSSLRMNRTMEERDTWSRETFSNDTKNYTRQEKTHTLDLLPAVRMRYNRVLKNEQQVRLEWYGNRGTNHYKRWYAYRTDDETTSTYDNATDGKSWHTSFKANYTKTFKNRSSLSVEGYQDYTRTDGRETREGNVSDVFLSQGNTRLYATYNYKIKNKLSLQVRLAEQLSFSRTENSTTVEHQFIPFFQLTYTRKAHNLRIKSTFRSKQPTASDMTTPEYKENEYMLRRGNPDLKNVWSFNSRISYTWTRERLSVMPYIQVHGFSHIIYDKIDFIEDRQIFIKQKENGKISATQQYGLNIQYDIIPQRFSVGLEGLYGHINTSLWKKFTLDAMVVGGYTTFMYKGFSVSASIAYQSGNFDPTTAVYTSRMIGINMQAAYSINNWNFVLYTYNPFFKNAYDMEYEQSDYRYKSHISRPRIETGNIFHITINYRFTFGNKKHKFHEEE